MRAIEQQLMQSVQPDSWLVPFKTSNEEFSDQDDAPIPYTFQDYLELVEWSGRAVIKDKPGSIPNAIPPIAMRLGLIEQELIEYLKQPDQRLAIGTPKQVKEFARSLGKKFFRNAGKLTKLFKPDK